MENINTVKAPEEVKPDEEHVVKMWTPYNIKVDENYKFISDNPVFNAVSGGLKAFALPALAGLNKLAFNLEIIGRENLEPLKDQGFITVCNHVNLLDCGMIANAVGRRDITFTTIKENFEIPVVRILVKLLGGIPIPRSAKAMAKFSEAVSQLLKEGHVIHFYPEGVLFPYYNGIRGFRRGAFSYAVKNDVPIAPMIITYHEPKSKLRKKPVAKIHVLTPVYPDTSLPEREAIRDLKDKVTLSMQSAFDNSGSLKDNSAVLAKYKK